MIHTFSFFFSSRRRHTRCLSDWSSDVCSSDLNLADPNVKRAAEILGQIACTNNFQDHDREPAQQDEENCGHVTHGFIVKVIGWTLKAESGKVAGMKIGWGE